MIDSPAKRFSWRFPCYGALGAVIGVLPVMSLGNDIGIYALSLLVLAAVSLILLIVAIRTIRRQWISSLSMLSVFCIAAFLFFRASDDVRSSSRWLIHAKTYKAQVLAERVSANGELKHMEWDGWGFPGAGDTVVYLVFDPNDSLEVAAREHSSGKFSGIPCEVYKVRRLEREWYTALFYTDTDWDRCH